MKKTLTTEQKNLKVNVKKWPIKNIISSAVSLGMRFQVSTDFHEDDLKVEKRILVNEINRRLRVCKKQ